MRLLNISLGERGPGHAAAVPAQAAAAGRARLPQRGGRRGAPALRPLRLPGSRARTGHQRLYRRELLPLGERAYLSVVDGVARLRSGLFAFQVVERGPATSGCTGASCCR
ncbi:uncharacterized protein LOC114359667 [Ostrinia furnacalis]|uniref:uncharacterized protein LOC114359667 n=1 Tax=Ostrinia furnacalis TaxID=93504 RepID=UPI00103C4230|nr:uncharacterized protein LOC114359667 [Ostrinia furnacalis]